MGNRRAITAPDIPEHPQPFPTAVRVGNMILSSALGGKNAPSGETSDDLGEQAAQAFANMRGVVEVGGGSVGDIAKVVVFLKDRKHRDAADSQWTKIFPMESGRPVRHTVASDLHGNLAIQLEFIAVVADG